MGTLSVSQAENLIKKGNLKEDTVETLQTEGVVSKRKRNTRKFMKTNQGNLVSPQIYFQGVNGDEYSKEMLTLKKQVQTLFDKYTTTK